MNFRKYTRGEKNRIKITLAMKISYQLRQTFHKYYGEGKKTIVFTEDVMQQQTLRLD